MEIKYKTDPLTKEKFIPKKISQKFATPANRIKYNNKKASKLNQERAFFDGPCRKSHSVLKSLFEIDPTKSHNMHFLMGKGVDFTASNHQANTNYGTLPAYYNYALRNIPNTDLYQIIKL
ncbi:hypothetical protein [Flavivirga rizhaonensis]|uniref:Uncharacterized protein n=1 Tax=Flavivirga rizhaonensis TaxID=2559571 RepID=A0A4S1DYW4_9FLAO|nr:hypothetical protein [Flavivirga rizhaonensis]TGV03400.1 hypothetical protein EM932_06925 [Flavivirga rizhaonensis]